MRERDLERVREALSQREEILFAYLFGSAAERRDSELSDVDIAVYLDPSLPRAKMLEVLAEIASELEPRLKVDLVLLNTASPSLAFEAIKGRPIVVRDKGALKEFVYRTLKVYHDRRYYDLRWARTVLAR